MPPLQQRWIIHADMDAFYASVEQRDNPQYKGQPVIVGGTSNRGVVCAASYEARKYGVHSAMPIVAAKRSCPQGIYLIPDIAKYARVSREIIQIFESFSPMVETLALDEAFMDVTGMEHLYPDVTEIARQIKERVWTELNLIVSVGVASNKFLAKLASALRKPDALVVIRPGEEVNLLAALPVEKLWGVGDATARICKAMNIATIGDLQQSDPNTLKRQLGKHAGDLYDLAWGRDDRPVVPDRDAKSIGNEDTFSNDIWSKEEIAKELLVLSERVGWRLRKAGLSGRTLTIKVRFSSFQTLTRSVTLPNPIALDEVIYENALQLMSKIPVKEGIRLLGITVTNFTQGGVQLSLFNNGEDKREKIAKVMDTLKERFGVDIVKRGRVLKPKSRIDE